MFKDAFNKLDVTEVAGILEEVNPLLKGVQFDPVDTTILSVNMPFYKGYQFLEIFDHTAATTRKRSVVYKQGDPVVLNYTNEPIYKLNKSVPLKLDINNVPEYIRFFFDHVRGRHGRFLICETIEDIHWKEEPPLAARKALAKMLKTIEPKPSKDTGGFDMITTMMFKDSLFKSRVIVDPKGFVDLKDEELMVEDVPVIDEILE